MISVVIPTLNDEEALVGTLGSLVSAAADGSVREVIVVDGGSTDGTRIIAEGAGCTFIKGPSPREQRLSIGAKAAKGPWLMFLSPGAEPEEGWFREARQFIERAERQGSVRNRAAVFRLVVDEPRGFLRELPGAIRRSFSGQPAGRHGLLIHRAFYSKIGGFRQIPAVEYVDLVRRIGRSRLVKLRSSLFVSRHGAPADLGRGVRRLIGSSFWRCAFRRGWWRGFTGDVLRARAADEVQRNATRNPAYEAAKSIY